MEQQADLVSVLLAQVQTLQAALATMQSNMELMKAGKPDGAENKDVPSMNIKDVEKPPKFSGKDWASWEHDFVNYIVRRDRRWWDILEAVKARSDKPLTARAIADIRAEEKLAKYLEQDLVYVAFREQLYEYLKSNTSGEVHAMVTSNGIENSFESWRRLCDQGKSRRLRPLRDEKRALYHPSRQRERPSSSRSQSGSEVLRSTSRSSPRTPCALER